MTRELHVINMVCNFGTETVRYFLNHAWHLWGLEIKKTSMNNKVRAIEKYSCSILSSKTYLFGINCRRATRGQGGGLPCPFLKIEKKCPDIGKKSPNFVYTWVESSIQNIVLRVSRGRSSKILPCGAFFLFFRRKVCQSAKLHKTSLALNNSGCAPELYYLELYWDQMLSVFYSNYRSSRPEVFCKKSVLVNFTKFTGKHLCQSFFFNKVADLGPQFY